MISAAGNIDHTRLVNLVGPVFETIQPRNGFPQRIKPQAASVVALNHRNLEQMHICLNSPGISITDPRRFACSLLNTILGGNMSSRLFQEVRERRGLAYSVYSFVASHVDTGMFGFYMGVDPKRARESVRLVLDEIARIKAGSRRFSRTYRGQRIHQGQFIAGFRKRRQSNGPLRPKRNSF